MDSFNVEENRLDESKQQGKNIAMIQTKMGKKSEHTGLENEEITNQLLREVGIS